jgi:hypothetical protein
MELTTTFSSSTAIHVGRFGAVSSPSEAAFSVQAPPSSLIVVPVEMKILFSDPARAANRVLVTSRSETGSKTPLSTSGVRLTSIICGTRDRSGTVMGPVFSGTAETGFTLCTEVAAVVPIEEVMRDDTLGEPVLVDFVIDGLEAIGLARDSRIDAGLGVNVLEVADDTFIDNMRCL